MFQQLKMKKKSINNKSIKNAQLEMHNIQC